MIVSGRDANRTFIFPRCCFNHEAERGVKRGVFVFYSLLLSPHLLTFLHGHILATRDTKKHTHSAAHTANMEPVGSRPSGEKVKCLLRLRFTRRLLCGIQALCIYIVCVCVCVLAFKELIIWIHVISNCAFGQYFLWKYSHNDFWTGFLSRCGRETVNTQTFVCTHTHTQILAYKQSRRAQAPEAFARRRLR